MSNWNYANDVPTAPWRSAMSIPRALRLRRAADGLRLVQTPVEELKKLRRAHQQFAGKTVAEANQWLRDRQVQCGPLEMLIEFAPASEGSQGVRLFKGSREETVVGVDRDQGRVFVDRTRSGNTTFHPKFAGVQAAPLAARGERIKLDLFVDACSVEVFVNDGEQVLTVLAFPSADSSGIEFFGPSGNPGHSSLELWPLTSIWK
jgi:fructan beta-fructosidase